MLKKMLHAQVGLAAQAGLARPARRRPGHDDVVAHGHLVHALADGDDLARALVAEDGRGGLGQRPVHGRQVGVAHAGGVDLDPDLAGTRVGHLDVVVDVDDLPCRPR